jgi:deoxyribodipyrimidine photo-lyase
MIILESDTVTTLHNAIRKVDACHVFRSENAGWYENYSWNELKKSNAKINFHFRDSHTLFDQSILSFSVADLSDSCTKFENAVSAYQGSKAYP